MLTRKNEVVRQNTDGLKFLMKKNKIDVFTGHGNFLSPTKISIQKNESESEEADFSDEELEERLKQSKLDLRDLKLAIAYSKGLPKEERKSFFKEFFKYYPIETEGHDWTKVPIASEIQVPIIRFDRWVYHHDHVINISAYDTAVTDAQGMELEVLQGLGNLLRGFNFLVVECSATPVYDGEVSAEEVINFLERNGFLRLTDVKEHDDILFRRRGILD
jgi:hypothetical protein